MLRRLRRRLLQDEQRLPIAMGKPHGDRDHRSRPQDTHVAGGETPANRGQAERNLGKAGVVCEPTFSYRLEEIRAIVVQLVAGWAKQQQGA
jgi:hypothetical protein